MSTYLLVNLAAISIPFAFSFHPKIRFDRYWFPFLKGCILTAIPFLIWDIIFTRLGVWGFNDRHLAGWKIFGMPYEEYLFFFCIPYACVFTYFALRMFIPKLQWPARRIFTVMGALLITLGLISSSKDYTTVTFLSMGIFAVALSAIKAPNLSWMLLTYLITLLPFYLTNGVLTGSWIPEEVVWYNDMENLGIRVGTIPIEDTIYGMLLILMNITFFDFFRKSHKKVDLVRPLS